MAIRHILAAAPTAVALSLALAGAAPAATVATAKCVPTFRPPNLGAVPIVGSGFTPGGAVTITYLHPKNAKPQIATVVTADANGAFAVRVKPAKYTRLTTQDQTFTLVATDKAHPTITAKASLRQVRAGFDITPYPTSPASRVTYTARGWEIGKNVYAHFRYHNTTYRDVKIGKARGPCGVAAKKMRALPTKTRYGTWTVFIDQRPKYSTKTRPQVADSFSIFRRPVGKAPDE